MILLENDDFLKQLSALFDSSKEHGSVWLTHKRLTYEGEAMEGADAIKVDEPTTTAADNTREYPCLLRCTNGKEINISTTITSSQLSTFHAAYGSLLKSALSLNLRKRDKKREKVRSEQSGLRKKRMAVDVPITGPKRGNGRKQRQRRVKAAVKQEEARIKFAQREAAVKEKKKAVVVA